MCRTRRQSGADRSSSRSGTAGQSWTMERNPYFWGPEPAVDRIEYRYYTNQEAMVQALEERRDRHRERHPDLGLFSALERRPDHHHAHDDLRLVAEPRVQLRWARATRHRTCRPWDDLDVRQSDRDGDRQGRDLVDLVYQGTADTRRHRDPARLRLLAPGHPRRRGGRVRPRRGERAPGRGGVHSTPTMTASARTRRPASPWRMEMPADQETVGAVEAGRLIVGYLDAIGIRVELQAVEDQNQMNEVWGSGRLRRVHLVLERRPRPRLPAVDLHLGPLRLVERRLLLRRGVRPPVRRAARHHDPRRAARRWCRRRSGDCTSRSRASCSRTRGSSRPTGTIASRNGRPRPVRRGTLLPATTTTRTSASSP